MEFGFTATHGRRTSKQQGLGFAPNPQGEETSAWIFGLEAAAGVGMGLTLQTMVPFMLVTYEEEGNSNTTSGVGDMSLTLAYRKVFPTENGSGAVGVAAGLFLPTGTRLDGELPSNANFVSGTVDPTVSFNLSWDWPTGLGLYGFGFGRFTAYQRDGFQAGQTFTWGAGVRQKLFRFLIPSIGFTALYRTADQASSMKMGHMDMGHGNGHEVKGSGGTWVYFTPGVAFQVLDGALRGMSVQFTAQIPVYQRVNGTQLVEDFNITMALRYTIDAVKQG